jgi:hypothetical protein
VTPDLDVLAMLSDLPPEEQTAALMKMFFPYENEQGVLDQEMALAQQLRQRGPERGSPTGALFGGLSNAIGGIGGARLQAKGVENQRAYGARAQGDATSRLEMLLRQMGKNKQPPPAMEDFEVPTPLPWM